MGAYYGAVQPSRWTPEAVVGSEEEAVSRDAGVAGVAVCSETGGCEGRCSPTRRELSMTSGPGCGTSRVGRRQRVTKRCDVVGIAME
jgi:hypothetical protein